jgi:large subunit ribosomal protein L6
MSRVGKNPVHLPAGVECQLSDREISVKGKLGQLKMVLTSLVKVEQADGVIKVTPTESSKQSQAMWGTTRNNIMNMVEGVSQGFKRRLEINGVGYRAALQGKDLILQLGFSHEIKYPVPEGITITCEKPTLIQVEGSDRQRVGQVAAEIRSYRGPEPYKGKGVRYEGEYVLRKEGKKK